jgi:protein-S-isoprenylcysteine O-methyltransferase Ste14
MTARSQRDALVIVTASSFGIGAFFLLGVIGLQGVTPFGWSETGLLVWDALLSLLFFLQHSGMVRTGFRRRWAAMVSPDYHGAVYTGVSGLVLALVALLWQRSDSYLFVLRGVYVWAARGFCGLALFVFAWSVWSLRSSDPLGLAALSRTRHADGTVARLEIRGPYRWVRHPAYASALVLIWSAPELTSDRLLFGVLWTAWIWMASVLEEADLLARFGNTYREYRRRVPRFVPWRPPIEVNASPIA